MHPRSKSTYGGLWYLLRAQCYGKLRRAVRRMWSPKRATLTIIALVVASMWFTQEFSLLYSSSQITPASPNQVLAWGPLFMLGLLALKLSPLVVRRDMAGVRFRSADAYILLAGPYEPSDVRFYKIVGHLFSVGITALFAAFFLWRHSSSWIHGFLGAFLSMTLIYLLYLGCAITVTYVRQTTYNVLRVAYSGILAVFAIHGLRIGLAHASPNMILTGALFSCLTACTDITQSSAGVLFFAPLHFLARIFIATSGYPELAWRVLVASLLNVALMRLILAWECWLLRNNAIVERQEFARNVTTPRESNRVPICERWTKRFIFPDLPWLSGLGPILWRQLCAVRRHAVSLFAIAMATIAATLWVLCASDRTPSQHDFSAWLLLMFFTNIILPGLLPFDFRSDYARISLLKSLPIPPCAIALGQLLVPVVIATAFQAGLLLAWWVVNPGHTWSLVIGPMFLGPINLLFFALENTVFLLYPYNPGEIGFHATVGRILKGAARLLLFALTAATAILFAYFTLLVVERLSPEAPPTGWLRVLLFVWWIGGGWVLVLTAAASMVTALCTVYTHFDLGTDGPLKTT